tara:strand:+ start:4012 stop:4764 length:753 start_codon:yes stop_codon:yes gene_type:complete
MTTSKTIRKYIREVKAAKYMNLLSESGYARVRQMMMGLVPSIGTLGILTAQNPGGQAGSAEENLQANANLMADLVARNYGVIPIEGSYGGAEDSFLVPNITRDDIAALGIKYGQEAVIWGRKTTEEVGEPYFTFEYLEGDKTIQTRDVSLGGSEVQGKEDFYSSKKGRKFYIPFFDDAYEGAKPADGGRSISLQGDELPDDSRIEEIVHKINSHVKLSLEENRTSKSRWHHRGLIKEYRKRLDEVLIEVN